MLFSFRFAVYLHMVTEILGRFHRFNRLNFLDACYVSDKKLLSLRAELWLGSI